MPTKKLETTHLEEIKTLQNEYSETYIQLGQAVRQKQYLTEELTQIETTMNDLVSKIKYYETEETKLMAKLKEAYGEGQIDLANGVFVSE